MKRSLSPKAVARERERAAARSRRRHGVRPRALALSGIRAIRAELAEYEDELAVERPRTRADCATGPRPCPWVGCKHHLFAETLRSGRLRLTFPDLDVSELQETCALDVADRGGASIEDIAALLNMTRAAAQAILQRVTARLTASPMLCAVASEMLNSDIRPRRRLPVLR